jgi:hypothetical protein
MRVSPNAASFKILRRLGLGCLIVGAGLATLWLLQFVFVMTLCVWGGQVCL